MAVSQSQLELDALAAAGLALASAATFAEALQIVASAAARAVHADTVILRAAEGGEDTVQAIAVATQSEALAAELSGVRLELGEVPQHEEAELERLPVGVRRAAERSGASAVVLLPVHDSGKVCGTLELMRPGEPFDDDERRVGRLAAAQASLAIRAFGGPVDDDSGDGETLLAFAGEALAAGADESRTASHLARFAVDGTRAHSALVWRRGDDGELEVVASAGADGDAAACRPTAERVLSGRASVAVEQLDDMTCATVQLGHPPIGALQLLFAPGYELPEQDLAVLSTYGVRGAHALRASIRSRTVALELDRTRALLAVVGQAISQLSLAHTLETAVARVAELFDVDRLAVYLRDGERLYSAAEVGLAGPHARLAERLLELSLVPFRSRGILVIPDVGADPRLAGVSDPAAEAGIEAAVAVPLLVHGEVTGLLGLFPARGQPMSDNESTLLAALAAQLGVAVQNAQLHERTTKLGAERERALDAERAASKQVRALYEISRSFAQSLSLEATLEAVTSTVVDVLDVDAALIRMPDERRDWLLPRALKVAEPRLDDAARAILFRPQPFGAHAIQRLFRLGEAFELDV